MPRSRVNAHRKIRVEEKEKPNFRFPEIQDKLPFTNNEIEKALGIKENGIRRIQLIGSRFEIKFKPSAAMMIANLDLEKTLKEQDVDCNYDESDRELNIFSDGLGDFIRFVKEKSKQ